MMLATPAALGPPVWWVLVYLVGAAVACGFVARWVLAQDTTGTDPVPPVPDQPDPYRIAYLQGAEREVARLLVFDLVHRGYLELLENETAVGVERYVRRAQDAPDPSYLTTLEKEVWALVDVPMTLPQLFRDRGADLKVETFCLAWRQSLERDNLIVSQERRRTVQGVWGLTMLGLAVSYVFLYLMHHPMLGPQIGAYGLALSMGAISTWAFWPRHRTRRGDRWLRSLREAYEPMLDRRALYGVTIEPQLLTLGAIFGPRVLATGDEALLFWGLERATWE